MKRKDVLESIKLAGYHNDSRLFTRLLCENRISRKAADDAYRAGTILRGTGFVCTCSDCIKKPLYTLEDYSDVRTFNHGNIRYRFTVPAGTRVTRKTAAGDYDPNYAFVDEFDWIHENNLALNFNAEHYGINVQGKVRLSTIKPE